MTSRCGPTWHGHATSRRARGAAFDELLLRGELPERERPDAAVRREPPLREAPFDRDARGAPTAAVALGAQGSRPERPPWRASGSPARGMRPCAPPGGGCRVPGGPSPCRRRHSRRSRSRCMVAISSASSEYSVLAFLSCRSPSPVPRTACSDPCARATPFITISWALPAASVTMSGPGTDTGSASAAELLDATLDLAGVALRLAQVLLQPLLVCGARRHPDVRLQRSLELLLLTKCLVQVLHELCLTGSEFGHLGPPL